MFPSALPVCVRGEIEVEDRIGYVPNSRGLISSGLISLLKYTLSCKNIIASRSCQPCCQRTAKWYGAHQQRYSMPPCETWPSHRSLSGPERYPGAALQTYQALQGGLMAKEAGLAGL